jgi:hypothetical protein
MDLVVAGRADHEGLAPPFRHEPGPCWLAGAGICEVSVHAAILAAAAASRSGHAMRNCGHPSGRMGAGQELVGLSGSCLRRFVSHAPLHRSARPAPRQPGPDLQGIRLSRCGGSMKWTPRRLHMASTRSPCGPDTYKAGSRPKFVPNRRTPVRSGESSDAISVGPKCFVQ